MNKKEKIMVAGHLGRMTRVALLGGLLFLGLCEPGYAKPGIHDWECYMHDWVERKEQIRLLTEERNIEIENARKFVTPSQQRQFFEEATALYESIMLLHMENHFCKIQPWKG